jgi:hypothetical protein
MAVGDSYRAFGVEPSPNYVEACRTLAAALIECEPYERPKKPSGAMRDMAFRGPFVVVDPESGVKRGRLLREHHDKERHMREAVRRPALASLHGQRGPGTRAALIRRLRFVSASTSAPSCRGGAGRSRSC